MLLGPIFRAELLRTARRRRYYVLRFLYSIVLLLIFWAGYEDATANIALITINRSSQFAEGTFIIFAIVQLVTILLLIPALFGGAIADEKQRKTLHYLMASRLSSFEIVSDKILGRVPHILVFLALGLPIVCLLGLIGGIAPEYVVVAYGGTISTALMAVAGTVLISTVSRRVRQAVLVAYVLLLAWQFAPAIIFAVGSRLYPITYAWIEPINTWIGATSPLFVYVASQTWRARMMGPFAGVGLTAWTIEQFVWMIGLQLGSAAFMVFLAVWRLRPAFRRHEATQPRRKWFQSSKERVRPAKPSRIWDRPECGNDAVSWKERYFARTDIFTKLVVLPATVCVSVVLVLYVGVDESMIRAVTDIWEWGFRARGSDTRMVEHLRIVTAWYVAIWLLSVAGATASSVAVEREEDTWTSLTSTPLTGWEILRGKVLGALWAQRGFALIPLGLWTFGLIFGAIHPLSFVATVIAFAVVTWMVAAVGMHASLRATSTSKAITATLTRLIILYAYPIVWLVLYEDAGFYNAWNSYSSYVGLPPRLVVAPLYSYPEFVEPWSVGLTYLYARWAGLLAMTIYVGVASFLTYRTVTRFDRWLDRPELSKDDRPHVVKTPKAAEPVLQS